MVETNAVAAKVKTTAAKAAAAVKVKAEAVAAAKLKTTAAEAAAKVKAEAAAAGAEAKRSKKEGHQEQNGLIMICTWSFHSNGFMIELYSGQSSGAQASELLLGKC